MKANNQLNDTKDLEDLFQEIFGKKLDNIKEKTLNDISDLTTLQMKNFSEKLRVIDDIEEKLDNIKDEVKKNQKAILGDVQKVSGYITEQFTEGLKTSNTALANLLEPVYNFLTIFEEKQNQFKSLAETNHQEINAVNEYLKNDSIKNNENFKKLEEHLSKELLVISSNYESEHKANREVAFDALTKVTTEINEKASKFESAFEKHSHLHLKYLTTASNQALETLKNINQSIAPINEQLSKLIIEQIERSEINESNYNHLLSLLRTISGNLQENKQQIINLIDSSLKQQNLVLETHVDNLKSQMNSENEKILKAVLSVYKKMDEKLESNQGVLVETERKTHALISQSSQNMHDKYEMSHSNLNNQVNTLNKYGKVLLGINIVSLIIIAILLMLIQK